MTELKAKITLDTHVLDHTVQFDKDIPKEKYRQLITEICGQWAAIGVTDYDDVKFTATHYPPKRISEIDIEVIERMIIVPGGGSARVIEGTGKLAA